MVENIREIMNGKGIGYLQWFYLSLCSVNFIPEPLYLIFNLVSDSALLQYFFLTLGNMHVGIGLNSSAT